MLHDGHGATLCPHGLLRARSVLRAERPGPEPQGLRRSPSPGAANVIRSAPAAVGCARPAPHETRRCPEGGDGRGPSAAAFSQTQRYASACRDTIHTSAGTSGAGGPSLPESADLANNAVCKAYDEMRGNVLLTTRTQICGISRIDFVIGTNGARVSGLYP